MSGFQTYFARPVGEDGPVKIGRSLSPWARKWDLRAPNGSKVDLFLVIPGDWERRFHARFADWHIGGEWFAINDELTHVLDVIEAGAFDLNSLPAGRRLSPCGRHYKGHVGHLART